MDELRKKGLAKMNEVYALGDAGHAKATSTSR